VLTGVLLFWGGFEVVSFFWRVAKETRRPIEERRASLQVATLCLSLVVSLARVLPRSCSRPLHRLQRPVHANWRKNRKSEITKKTHRDRSAASTRFFSASSFLESIQPVIERYATPTVTTLSATVASVNTAVTTGSLTS